MELTAATEAYRKASVAINEAGGEIRTEATKALRDIAKPYGKYVLLVGAQGLPRAGGLQYKVASAGVSSSTSSTLRATVTIGPKNALARLDRGILRHPVFARPDKTRKDWTWVNQTVHPRLFSRPFEDGVPQIRTAMITALNQVLRKVASSA